MENGISLADIASVTKDNDGMFAGNGGMWIFALLILLLIGNGGFGGFGNNSRYANSALNTFATASSQNEILLGQKFDALSRQINQVGDGLCSSTYALNNSIINEGRTLGTAVSNGFANVQNCCCDLKYDMATQFANVNANTTAQTQKILDALCQNKIESLQAEVNTLKTQNMFCGIPKINPYLYGVYPYNTGCNNAI